MSGGMAAKLPGLQNLPPWDLGASHAQLYEQLEQTKVMLVTYELYLSDLLTEHARKPSRRKAQAIEVAAGDVRAAYNQYVAIGSCFRQKSKDADLRKEVKEAMDTAQKEHSMLQGKADEVAESQLEEVQVDRGNGGERYKQMKPVKELEPSIVAHFKLSGTELEKWSNQMTIWSLASGFTNCANEVQCAFAAKFIEQEVVDKVKEAAEEEEISLDFKTFVEKSQRIMPVTKLPVCEESGFLFDEEQRKLRKRFCGVHAQDTERV